MDRKGAGGRLRIGTFHALALRQLKAANTAAALLASVEQHHIIQQVLIRTGSSLTIEEAPEQIAQCKVDADYARDNPEIAKVSVLT